MENTIKSPYSDDVLGTIINFLPNEAVATVACAKAALPPFIVDRWQLHCIKGEHSSKRLFRFLALSNVNSETQQLYNTIKGEILPNDACLKVAYKFRDLKAFANLLSNSSEFDFFTVKNLFIKGLKKSRLTYSKLIWTHQSSNINTLFACTIDERLTEETIQTIENEKSRANGLLMLASYLGHTSSFNELIARPEIKPFAIRVALKQACMMKNVRFIKRLRQHPLSIKQDGEQRSRRAPRILRARQPFQH